MATIVKIPETAPKQQQTQKQTQHKQKQQAKNNLCLNPKKTSQ